jgi:ornithine carbamoyltransferase
MKRDLISIFELGEGDIQQVFERASYFKKTNLREYHPLKGKCLGLIFYKPSTRTRISFEVAVYQLGGHPLFLSAQDLQLGRGESIQDTARVLSRYIQGIIIRTFAQKDIEELATYASIPVINALSDLYHPCQILTDIFTILEKFGSYQDIKVAYIGDGNNVANSWLAAAAKLGINLSIASPKGYGPKEEIIARARQIAQKNNYRLEVINDPYQAVRGADIIYTDVWISMGMENEAGERLKAFTGYQVDKKLVAAAQKPAFIMHCLPAHRGQEITAEVLDGEKSLIYEQVENRLYVQKAILDLWIS